MNFLKKHKNAAVYAITVIIPLLFVCVGYQICKPDAIAANDGSDTYTARVTDILDTKTDSYSLGEGSSIEIKQIAFTAEITSSNSLLTGLEVTAVQSIDGMLPVNPKEVEVGNKVLLSHLDAGDGTGMSWLFMEYQRSDALIILCLFFFALIILFGRKKGVNTIVSLIFTVLAVFMVFVPAIIKGYNIYLMSIIVAVFTVLMTLILINGISKKTLCAIAGNVGGLLVSGLLVFVLQKILFLTGAVDEEAIYLLYLNEAAPIDLNGVIFAGIIIGALGAIMDVAMTIASAMQELAENMDNRSFKTMLKSGINIGRDAMSTMTNTLVLAYIGSSLAVVLLLIGNNSTVTAFFNREMIVTEVIRAIVGSIGILCALPITSVTAAYIYNRNRKKSAASGDTADNPQNSALSADNAASDDHTII